MQARRIAYVVVFAGILVLSYLGAAHAAVGPADIHPSATHLGVPTVAGSATTPVARPTTAGAGGPSVLARPEVVPTVVPAAPSHPDVSPYTFILPDGTLSGPGAATISVSGNVYTLTTPLVGAIVDERNGSTFDGGGNTIATSTALLWGFQVNTTTDVSVNDLVITGAAYGVEVLNSTDVTVYDTTAGSAADAGFYVSLSSDLTFHDDYSNSSAYGFYVYGASDVTLLDCITNTDTSAAFTLDSVRTASLEGDLGEHSSFEGFYGQLDQNVDFVTDTFSDATDYGMYLVLSEYVNLTAVTAETCADGLVGVANGHWNLTDSNFSYATDYGAEIVYTNNVTGLHDDFFEAGIAGLRLDSGGTDTLQQVNANSSTYNGIDLWNLTGVTLSESYASGDGWNGLSIESSHAVLADNDSFNDATGSSGNGTYTVLTTDVVLTHDLDMNDPGTGVYDVGSHGLELLSTNASNDEYGVDFVLDDSPSAESVIADHDDIGFVVQLSSGFWLQSDNASFDDGGLEEVAAIGGHVEALATYDCTDVGMVSINDLDGDYVGDSAVNTVRGVVTDEDTDTVLDAVTVTGATVLGVELEDDSGVTLEASTVSTSAIGFVVEDSTFTSVITSSFAHDTDDFFIDAAGLENVLVYWNNFVDGAGWDFDAVGGNPSSVAFDAGYPAGGNYWSNWTTPDTEHGPDQNLPGADGIVDVPLLIGGAFEDHYPLTRALAEANLTVTFKETGLPAGATWGVDFGTLGGTNTTASSLGVFTGAAAWATYNYSVYAPAGWIPSPLHASITTDGTVQTVTIDFTQVTYSTTFTEAGLATGVGWSVDVAGTTYTGTGATITVALGNGTYNYTVPAIAGYSVAPATGAVTVTASPQSVAVTFTAYLYTVTFTESGLPSGTTWSVTFGGTAHSSSGTTVTFDVANGSYAYTVAGVSGYSLAPSSGTQLVAGPGSNIGVAFVATPSALASTLGGAPFWGLLVLVVILALLVLVLATRRASSAPASRGRAPRERGSRRAPGGPRTARRPASRRARTGSRRTPPRCSSRDRRSRALLIET